MSFGNRLKERRTELGITQVQLAKMLKVTKGAIGNYEAGISSPKAEILYKIFDTLKCDANFLFQDEMTNIKKSPPPEKVEEEDFIDDHVYRKAIAFGGHGNEIYSQKDLKNFSDAKKAYNEEIIDTKIRIRDYFVKNKFTVEQMLTVEALLKYYHSIN